MKTDEDKILNGEEGKIEKEVIHKDQLPTDKHHPNEEISEENKIILGDQIEGVEPSPTPLPKGKPNYVLILTVIVVVILGLFWGMKGCNERAAGQNHPTITTQTAE